MQIELLSIEDLAALRDRVLIVLADKVAARQKELLAESERVGDAGSFLARASAGEIHEGGVTSGNDNPDD